MQHKRQAHVLIFDVRPTYILTTNTTLQFYIILLRQAAFWQQRP